MWPVLTVGCELDRDARDRPLQRVVGRVVHDLGQPLGRPDSLHILDVGGEGRSGEINVLFKWAFHEVYPCEIKRLNRRLDRIGVPAAKARDGGVSAATAASAAEGSRLSNLWSFDCFR